MVNKHKQSRHITVPCAQCGRAAAEIALLPESVPNKALWVRGDRLERTEFLGEVIRYGRFEQLEDLFEAIRQADYTLAAQIDPDFVAFACQKCQRAYCQECWIIEAPQFDEDAPDVYDCTYGVCPVGHRQMVDD